MSDLIVEGCGSKHQTIATILVTLDLTLWFSEKIPEPVASADLEHCVIAEHRVVLELPHARRECLDVQCVGGERGSAELIIGRTCNVVIQQFGSSRAVSDNFLRGCEVVSQFPRIRDTLGIRHVV